MLVVTVANVIVVFMTSFTLAADVIAGRKGSLQADVNDYVFSDDVVFEVRVATTLRCAAICARHDCCFAFTTTPWGTDPTVTSWRMTCRGHASLVTASSAKSQSAGSRTFHINRQTGSGWLNSTCTSGTCPGHVNAIECFAGLCLCQPGYYYSKCQDDCVQNCPAEDLRPTFTRYPYRHISGNNIQTVRGLTSPEDCKAACILRGSDCRSYDLEMVTSTCWLQTLTALDVGSAFEYNPNDDYFQRWCF